MKVLMAVKRIIDFNVESVDEGHGSGAESANAKMSMNPMSIVIADGCRAVGSPVAFQHME